MNESIQAYNAALATNDQAICNQLAVMIDLYLPQAESKIWHGHPVWFLDGNPVTGYSKLKESVQLLFWSGQSFDEDELVPTGRFKAAEKRYQEAKEIKKSSLKTWLKKAQEIQWDYKNIVKRKGQLERLV